MAEFLAFLTQGELGPLRPGLTREAVVELLGPPTDTSNPEAISPPLEILWYSRWLELTFNEGVLDDISLRYKWQRWYYRRLRLPGVLQTPWVSKVTRWSYARFRTLLHTQGLGFDLTVWSDGSLMMECRAGGIVFNDVGRSGLYSVGFSAQSSARRGPLATWQAPPSRLRPIPRINPTRQLK